MTFQLIGLTGPAGSGKDTAAFYLCDKYNFTRYAFAQPIKDMLRVIGVDANTRETKELPHPVFGASPRRMAQTLGTDWMRNMVCEDGWLRLAFGAMNAASKRVFPRKGETVSCRGLVITDVRFENEARWVRNNSGQIWQLCREVPAVEGHVSECPLHPALVDRVLCNHGTIEEMHLLIDALMGNCP